MNHLERLLAGSPNAADPAVQRFRAALAIRAQEHDLLDVAYRTIDTPVGQVLLAATPAGLVRVAYARQGHDAVLTALASQISPRVLFAPRRLDDAARQLDGYFARDRRGFDLAVDLRLAHGFRRAVLEHLPDVGLPPGRAERRISGRLHRRTRDQARAPRARAGTASLTAGPHAPWRWRVNQTESQAPTPEEKIREARTDAQDAVLRHACRAG